MRFSVSQNMSSAYAQDETKNYNMWRTPRTIAWDIERPRSPSPRTNLGKF